ncbi:sugar permease [Lactobacillus sp. CBA3605]|uniref:PTS sugar transporter subunit IIA n=1 Tax=Lactobacillus sp. CBA3605 TaxID=2099788 RepID=UPI000CFABF29|nr:PTS glucose transporter subunit IIA [Lactobacillus sp. CBA3605]AVK61414.1 sugar permease [Lactobacillus sp. CBA3605]
MSFFKQRKVTIYAPATGNLKAIEKVPDQVFSSKAMGDGFAIEPKDGAIYAPIEGQITSIFPTKHAISLKTKGGFEILLHLGIDTVELNRAGFDIVVAEGDKVTATTKLVNMNLNYLAKQNKVSDVMVIFTNLEKHSVNYNEMAVTAGQVVGEIQ